MGVYTPQEIMEMGQQHRPGRDATATPASNIDTIIKEHQEEKGDSPIVEDVEDAEIVEGETEQQPVQEDAFPGCGTCEGRGLVEETDPETGEMSKGPCPECSKKG